MHESGHALAMCAFGGRDLHMFFVPLGAVVTGGRPREPTAWKETIVPLAGPVSGMVAGLLVLASPLAARLGANSAAFMAVVVSAFNPLPLTLLDGGRLVEIALFSRWPRAHHVPGAQRAGAGGRRRPPGERRGGCDRGADGDDVPTPAREGLRMRRRADLAARWCAVGKRAGSATGT